MSMLRRSRPGGSEEGSAAELKRRNEVKELFIAYLAADKKLQQTIDKYTAVPANNKKLRKKWAGKVVRARVELSLALARYSVSTRALEGICPGDRDERRKRCPRSSTEIKKLEAPELPVRAGARSKSSSGN